MAGGVGTRFWPLSKTSKPKQFLDILGTGKTLLQQTFDRISKICPIENIFIVTNEDYKELTALQLPRIKEEQILLEPMRRNTAPCIAYAAFKIKILNPNANIIVAPSDHLILKEDEFVNTVNKGIEFVSKNDALLTLGIKPSRPDTGYGYIQINNETQIVGNPKLKQVKTFTEKPELEMAKFFVESGEFFWNSGIFIWSLKSILSELKKHLPDVYNLFNDGNCIYNTPKEKEFILNTYSECKNVSIDYGVMEKSDNVYVMCSDFGWSDLGTWGSLYEHSPKDNQNNAISGNNTIIYKSSNCIINLPNDKLVVIQGLNDYIIAESDNTLLICPKKDEQNIRQIVNDVKLKKGDSFV